MSNNTISLVVAVYNNDACDLYIPLSKKEFSYDITDTLKKMMQNAIDVKVKNPEKDIAELFRNQIDNRFFGSGLVITNKNIFKKIYMDLPNSINTHSFVGDNELENVYLCDLRVDSAHTPEFYKAGNKVFDDDCVFELDNRELDDLVSDIRRCEVPKETFNDLVYYSVKDDREINVCQKSIGNLDYFKERAKIHANNPDFIGHRTYVYEHKNDRSKKVWGCCKFYGGELKETDITKEYEDELKETYNTNNDSIKEKFGNAKDNSYKTNHYEFNIDNKDWLRLYNCSVEVIEKTRREYKAKFYVLEETRKIFEHPDFSIGSNHLVRLNLYNPDGSKTISLHNPVTLKQKRFCCDDINKSSTLTIELIFVESYTQAQVESYKQAQNPIF